MGNEQTNSANEERKALLVRGVTAFNGGHFFEAKRHNGDGLRVTGSAVVAHQQVVG